MLAASQIRDAGLEVVEGHGEVPRGTARTRVSTSNRTTGTCWASGALAVLLRVEEVADAGVGTVGRVEVMAAFDECFDLGFERSELLLTVADLREFGFE